MSLKINEEVKKELQSKGIPLKDGLPVLLSIYFNLEPEYIPKELKVKVLSTNIVSIDYESDTIVWNTSLFDGQENNFEWIEEYMEMFKSVNKDRRGLKSSVLKRMKKFFMTYPDIRKDEVMEATSSYLKTIENPTYCITSHKFISNEHGEPLKDWVDEIRKSKTNKPEYSPNPFTRLI